MTVYNATDLQAQIDNLLPNNTSGDISPTDVRTVIEDVVDSLKPIGGAITDGNVTSISITGTPTLYNHYTSNTGPTNELFAPDFANGVVDILDSGVYLVGVTFEGEWATTEDLVFEFYINGAAHPTSPLKVSSAGDGASDPTTISFLRQTCTITEAMITAGGGSAELALYAYSTTGTFSLDQNDIIMGAEYYNLTINAVG